jgi:hypothetical protein
MLPPLPVVVLHTLDPRTPVPWFWLACSGYPNLIRRIRLNTQEDRSASVESILRLFWSCFLSECHRLAELELPQSELQLTDETSLPGCNNLNPMESTCYLAEISIRRLLNRIHNSLYPRKRTALTLSSTSLTTSDEFSAREISSATAVCDELHRQLDLWYESIPEPFRPILGTEPTSNDRESVLRIRYYATKHIIYRPFVLYLIRNGPDPVTIQFSRKQHFVLRAAGFTCTMRPNIVKS